MSIGKIGEIDITIYRGDYFEKHFGLAFEDENGDLIPYTMNNVSEIRADIKRYIDGPVITTMTYQIIDGSNGYFKLYLDETQTAELDFGLAGFGYYDIQVVENSIPKTFIRGKVLLIKDITL